MKISTNAQYKQVVKSLRKKGYTAADVFPVLEEAGFSVQIKKPKALYEGIYASRVIAMMHHAEEAPEKAPVASTPLKL